MQDFYHSSWWYDKGGPGRSLGVGRAGLCPPIRFFVLVLVIVLVIDLRSR
jgi:hypothetical protein